MKAVAGAMRHARRCVGGGSGVHRTNWRVAMAPRVRAGDYVWVDPDEPAADGRRTLHALDGRCPERTVDAGNETDIRGVVVFVGNEV